MIDKFLNLLSRITNRLSIYAASVSIYCVFALSALVAGGVLSRYFLGEPILGVDEISGYLNVVIGFLALAYTLQEGKHVRVDIITNRLPKRAKNIIEIITSILALILIGQLLRASWYTWVIMIKAGERDISYLQTPLAIPYGLMIVGWVLLFLAILLHVHKTVKNLRTKTQ